jgi:hypothetical protein
MGADGLGGIAPHIFSASDYLKNNQKYSNFSF